MINEEMTEHNFFHSIQTFPKRCPHCGKKHTPKARIHRAEFTLSDGSHLTQFVPIWVCHKKKKSQVIIDHRAIIMQMVVEMWEMEFDEYPSMQ